MGLNKSKTISLDLPKELLENIDISKCGETETRQRQRSVYLRKLLMDAVDRHYNMRTGMPTKEIKLMRGLPSGETVRIGLPVPMEYIKALDKLCVEIPLTRKSLAEYFIGYSYVLFERSEKGN